MSVTTRKLALSVSMIVAVSGTAGLPTGAWAICIGQEPSFGCTVNGNRGEETPCAPDPNVTGPQKIEAPTSGCLNSIGDTVGCVIEGGPGDDILVGSLLNDTICANDGNDMVFAKAGNDTVFMGDNPADTRELAFGQFGDDLLNGDAGDDVLAGGQGPDRNVGGSENSADFCVEALQNAQCEVTLSESP